MSRRISWTLNLQVAGGPPSAVAQAIEVEAIDLIEVVVPGDDGAGGPGVQNVEVQPTAAANRVQLLMIRSSRYSDQLTYTVQGGVADIPLQAELFLVGGGAMTLLGAAPGTLQFSNGLGAGNNATISILVGRDATP
jgi:hypothetical protein